ncbi:MAG: sulfurtransferase TusC, partial [Gammaproteobacteria bacterium]|nr:sulfurtransferase TusC [Gammaproteobacteria bacterium]
MTELLFILSHPPGASVYAQEAFDAALAGSAFSNIAILFVGAGCLQLIQPKL